MTTNYRIVDLFAGIGGLSTGVKKAITENGGKYKIVFTSEIKKHAIATLIENGSGTVNGDITKIEADQIPQHDILLAGFPCQAFSYAGTRNGFGDSRGTLFFDVERILKHHMPEYFILENVEGLITHDRTQEQVKQKAPGRTLTTILDRLNMLDYTIKYEVLDASYFGVAQARKRVFIIGSRTKKTISFPKPGETQTILSSILEQGVKETDPKVIAFSKQLRKHYSDEYLIGKVIRDKRGGPNNLHSWDFNFKGPTSNKERELLEQISFQSKRRIWSKNRGIPYKEGIALTIQEIASFSNIKESELSRTLTKLSNQRYLIEENGEYRILSGKLSFPIANIVNPNKPSLTIVATDSSRIGILDTYGIRRLTLTELKKLFGFDDITIPASLSKAQVFDLFGNSVSPLVAKAVAEELIFKETQ